MRVCVKSFGCSTNLADGEVLAGCLAEAGSMLVDCVESAELVVLNTCAVKGPTENRMIELACRISANRKIIIAGCLPLVNFERLAKNVRFDGVIGPAAGRRIVDVLRRVSGGEKVIDLGDVLNSKPDLSLPRARANPVTSVIPISYGCLGSCAYCCVVFARGRLRSYSVQEIADRLKKDLAAGTREFWLTSQDTACYGRDIGTDLAELLNALCSFEGDFRIRVGMMTPNTALDILDELIQAFRSPRVFKFVHLPVQSGDDQVLRRMRRFYSVVDFRKIVSRLREFFPEMTLSTDVICGFPGESEEAFERTLHLIREVGPDVVNVSKFFPRPRTSAADMQDSVSAFEIRRRSGMAAALAKEVSFAGNQRWVGWKGEILVDEVGKTPGSWIGRNMAYKPVVVKSDADLLGESLRVKAVRAFSTYLEGEIAQ